MVTKPEPNDESMNKTFGGSPQCIEENLEFFIQKLRQQVQTKEKLTFRQWTNRMMNLLDLID